MYYHWSYQGCRGSRSVTIHPNSEILFTISWLTAVLRSADCHQQRWDFGVAPVFKSLTRPLHALSYPLAICNHCLPTSPHTPTGLGQYLFDCHHSGIWIFTFLSPKPRRYMPMHTCSTAYARIKTAKSSKYKITKNLPKAENAKRPEPVFNELK